MGREISVKEIHFGELGVDQKEVIIERFEETFRSKMGKEERDMAEELSVGQCFQVSRMAGQVSSLDKAVRTVMAD